MPLSPGDDRYDHFVVERISDYPHGYPRLAAVVNADAETHLYRRFGQLRARLLLHYQDEISQLEDQLCKLDNEHAQSPTEKIRLHSRRWDEGEGQPSKRKELIEKIDNRLEKYDNLILRQDSMLRLQQPTKELHRQYFNWIFNEKPLVPDEYAFIYRDQDFVALGMSADTWLGPLVKQIGRAIPDSLLKKFFSLRKTEETKPDDLLLLSDARTQKFVKAIVGMVSVLMLLLPVCIFYVLAIYNVAYGARIGVLFGFTIAFNAALLGMTNVTKQELFGASAGYVAVLVVFLGNLPQHR